MRVHLILLPLALVASPAVAAPPETIEVPKELTDPANTDRLVKMMQALSKSFLAMPIGEVEAAAEGRQPTAADKGRTIGSETRMTESQLKAQLEASKPMLEASMKALVTALPAMMKGLSEAAGELEKAKSNLPQPGYPKR